MEARMNCAFFLQEGYGSYKTRNLHFDIATARRTRWYRKNRQRLVVSVTERLQRELLQRHRLTSSRALRSLRKAVLSLLPSLHLLAWARRRPLFMISTLSAWTAWCYITRRWSLICGGASINIARGRRREVMCFRTRSALLSVLLVRPHSLHWLVMMELLRRVIVLRLVSKGFSLL